MRLWHAAEAAAMALPVCNDRLLYVPALIMQICLRIYRLFAGSANPRRMGSCINKALLLTIAFWLLAILSLSLLIQLPLRTGISLLYRNSSHP